MVTSRIDAYWFGGMGLGMMLGASGDMPSLALFGPAGLLLTLYCLWWLRRHRPARLPDTEKGG